MLRLFRVMKFGAVMLAGERASVSICRDDPPLTGSAKLRVGDHFAKKIDAHVGEQKQRQSLH
jgi:hypothetical protein